MGYIYKIQNILNNKVYIGQTVKAPQKRFQQHKNNFNKPYFSQIVLYKAFKKYGIENFSFEVIEKIENEKLDEREKFWINYYDSYFDGYNSTLGGRLVELYNWDIDDIIDKYFELKSARKVANEIGCDHSTIDHILNANGIKRFSPAQQQSKKVVLEKEDDKKFYFETTTEVAEWLIQTKQTKSSSIRNLRQTLTQRIINGKKYFGYKVYYGE